MTSFTLMFNFALPSSTMTWSSSKLVCHWSKLYFKYSHRTFSFDQLLWETCKILLKTSRDKLHTNSPMRACCNMLQCLDNKSWLRDNLGTHAYRWINIAINYLYQHFRLRRLESNCRANGFVGFVRQTLHDKNTAKCLWKITREPSDCTTWRRTSCGKFNVSRIVNLERELSEEWKEFDGVWWSSAGEVCSRVSLALLDAVTVLDET